MSKMKQVVFETLEEALEYIGKRGVPLNSIEGQALGEMAKEGTAVNLFKETSSLRKMKKELSSVGGMGPPPLLDGPPPFDGMPPIGEQSAIGASVALGRFVAPRQKTFLRLESQTKIPVYSELYRPMEDALLKKRVFVGPWATKADALLKGVRGKHSEGYAAVLQTIEGSSAEQKVIEQFGLDSGKTHLIRNWFDDLFGELGIGDARPYFQQMVPKIQTMGRLSKAYPDSKMMPTQLQFLKRYIEWGHIPLWRSQADIRQWMFSHLHSGSFHRFAGGVWEGSRKLWDSKVADPSIPRGVKGLVTNYLDDIVGKTSSADSMVLEAMGKGIVQANKAVRHLGDEVITKEEAMHSARRFFGWMWALNYSANLGFRPAAVARQFLQTLQTTTPRYGFKAVYGTGGGIQRLATKEGQDLVSKAGILVEESPFFGEEGIRAIGGKIFRRADNVQRAIAGLAVDSLLTRHLPTYTKNGDWAKFLSKSKVGRLHILQQKELKEIIDSGKIMDARLAFMRHASESTQWIYRRGNQPEAFRGLGGRLFGQYGIWPAYYADFMNDMFRHGPMKDRVSEVARWTAINAAIGTSLSAGLGASAASWIWFQPVGFTGGPYFQILTDLPKAASQRGPDSNLAKYRLKRAPLQLIPGAQAGRDLFEMYKELEEGDTQGAVRELFGYPAEKP